MQHCPNCGAGELKIIAAILERPEIEKILTHLGLNPQLPPRGRAVRSGKTDATSAAPAVINTVSADCNAEVLPDDAARRVVAALPNVGQP